MVVDESLISEPAFGMKALGIQPEAWIAIGGEVLYDHSGILRNVVSAQLRSAWGHET